MRVCDQSILISAIAVLLVVTFSLPLVAGEIPPLRDVVDREIADGWKTRGVIPAQPASDAEFHRRVCLDLVGTIPTADQTRAFLDDASPDKRATLVDRLLASPEYARHMQHVFDVMLLERLPGGFVTEREWADYLRASFAENKPWDQLTREILGGDGNDPATRGAARWLMIRNLGGRPTIVATKISRDIVACFWE